MKRSPSAENLFRATSPQKIQLVAVWVASYSLIRPLCGVAGCDLSPKADSFAFGGKLWKSSCHLNLNLSQSDKASLPRTNSRLPPPSMCDKASDTRKRSSSIGKPTNLLCSSRPLSSVARPRLPSGYARAPSVGQPGSPPGRLGRKKRGSFNNRAREGARSRSPGGRLKLSRPSLPLRVAGSVAGIQTASFSSPPPPGRICLGQQQRACSGIAAACVGRTGATVMPPTAGRQPRTATRLGTAIDGGPCRETLRRRGGISLFNGHPKDRVPPPGTRVPFSAGKRAYFAWQSNRSEAQPADDMMRGRTARVTSAPA